MAYTSIVSSQIVTSEVVISGTQSIVNGGIANSNTINDMGDQNISSGGVANSTTINSGGYQCVFGGVANFTTIDVGGYQSVFAGGVANDTIANSSGSMNIQSGGSATGFLMVNGGHVVLDNADSVSSLATMSYVLATANANDVLVTVNDGILGTGATTYSLNLDDTAAGSYILAEGVDLSGISSQTFTVTDDGQTVDVTVGSSYTFINGDRLSLNFTDDVTDQFNEGVTDQLTATLTVGEPTVSGADYSGQIEGTRDTGLFGWYYRYDVAVNGDLQVTLTVDMQFDGDDPGDELLKQWIDGIERIWSSQYSLVDGNSALPIVIDVNEVFSDADQVVTVHAGSGTGRTDMTNWYTTDPGGWSNDYQDEVAAHEFGHMLGLYDEYTGGAVSPEGLIDHNSLMGADMDIVRERYFFQVEQWAENITGREMSLVNTTIISIAVTDAIAGEPNNNGNFRISRTGLTSSALTVYFSSGGTATSGHDYALNKGSTTLTSSVVIAAGQSYVDVTLAVIDDSVVESTETVIMNLAANAAYSLGATTSGTINISDNDVPDTTPPTVPSALKQTVTGGNVAFDWADSTDASGVKQYEVRVDNNSNFSSPEHTETVIASQGTGTGIPVGTYYWQVRAQDNSGNWSAWSQSASFVIMPTDTAANTWQTAKDISGGVDNRVGLNDPADYYKLIMTNAGTLTLGLTGLSGDVNLSLLDGTGKVLKTSANKGLTGEAISMDLLTGTYYVNVAPVSGVNNAAYTLTHAEKYFSVDKAANIWQAAADIATIDSWVGFGDPADYYKLIMDKNGTLTLGLTGLTGDATLSLLDAKGKVLKTSANKGNASESIANLLLTSGTYYVNVAPVKGVNSAAYTLTHAENYFPDDKAANTWQTAKDIATIDNWVGFGDPADCYKLAMTGAGTLTLNLTGLTGDANLSLLDSKGKVLKTSANRLNTAEAITSDLLAGTYYVNVAPVKGVNSAAYTLTHAENYFPDDTALNTFALAKQVTARGTVNEWLGFGDKDDYYMFELQTATAVNLDLTDMTSNVNLYLYDSKNKQLAASAKSGNADESITKTLAAGKYYVKATLAGKENTDYSLNFGIDPSAFKTGSLQLSSAASPLTGSADTTLGDTLKKDQGLLAS